jgi:TonB family protein
MNIFSRRTWSWSALFSPWLLVSALSIVLVFSVCAQTSSELDAKRRIVERTAPAYPALARSMGLAGSVRVEAVINLDGSVKAVEVKGGHPVLAQAAVNAVRKWKWEPSSHESHQIVEVKFDTVE